MLMKSLAASFFLLALCGCLPESEHPIAPPDPAGGDLRLLGAWLHISEDGYSVLHAFKTEGRDWQFVVADHDVEGFGDTETYIGHTTHLPSGDYLNVLVTGSETGYLILRYEFIDKDRVRMSFSSTDALIAAVKSGALAGSVVEESTGPDIRITASSQQWQNFLAKPPSGLFDEPLEMERIGPALVAE
jgi:hypothetical protein